MSFVKAEAKQARLRMALYGPAGSGKTFTALLFAEGLAKHRGKRIAVIDTERTGGGTDFYARKRPSRVHPEAFDFDAVYTRSLATVLEEIKAIDTSKYGVIVIDSISSLWDAAIEAVENRTSIGTIKMQDWGKVKKPYKELINLLMTIDADVILCGRQKNVFEEDESGELRKSGVTLKAEGETAYEPQICARMEVRTDSKRTTMATYLLFAEKDRTGVLAGRTISNPGYETIEPVVALLGDEHPVVESDEERIARDSELIEAREDKTRAKQEKSGGLMATFQVKILGASTLETLGLVNLEIKKQRRYMLEEHLAALRTLYEEQRRRVVEATAPEVA